MVVGIFQHFQLVIQAHDCCAHAQHVRFFEGSVKWGLHFAKDVLVIRYYYGIYIVVTPLSDNERNFNISVRRSTHR